MTLNDVLLALLEPISVTGEAHWVTWDVLQDWPDGALEILVATGLLSRVRPGESVECRGCEKRCFMDVHCQAGEDGRPDRAFVVCNDPEMQSQMGRIPIPLERLNQWKATPLRLAKVVAGLLGVETKVEARHGTSTIRIGMLKGKRGRRWLSLNRLPLALEANDDRVPLEEVLSFEHRVLAIDKARIRSLIDKAPSSAAEKRTPSAGRREERRHETEAMHQDWRDAYRMLRREHGDTRRHSDTWISQQIARMPIARSRNPETIRRIMKK